MCQFFKRYQSISQMYYLPAQELHQRLMLSPVRVGIVTGGTSKQEIQIIQMPRNTILKNDLPLCKKTVHYLYVIILSFDIM